MVFNFATILLLGAAVVSALLAVTAWRHRSAPGGTVFTCLMIALAEWCVGSALEIASPGFDAKILWAKIQYLGVVAVPAFWFLFILHYTGRLHKITPRLLAGLAIEPLLVLTFVWTNESHHLFWRSLRLVSEGGFNVLAANYHYVFWIHMIYSYFLILGGAVFLLTALVRFSHLYRGQIGILLLGGLAPLAGNFLYVFHVLPTKIFDLTPFGFAISGLAFSWGLIFMQFLNIAPVARGIIIESMKEAVFVLDIANRVSDANPAAIQLAGIEKPRLLGEPVTKVLGRWGEIPDDLLVPGEAATEIAIGPETGRRFFEVRMSPLRQGNHPLGRVMMIYETTAQRQAAILQNDLGKLYKTIDTTVQMIAQIVEIRDPYTAGHQKRVAALASAIAEEMGYQPDRVFAIRMAALCHDVGKMGIPVEILNKPGKLTAIEFSMIHTHSARGYEILKTIEFPWPIAQMVLQHHERLDGSGYPQGLKGPDILAEAKILGVADVVEAMTNDRPYRPALGIKAAMAEIVKLRGVFFEPQVVDACLRLFSEKDYRFEISDPVL